MGMPAAPTGARSDEPTMSADWWPSVPAEGWAWAPAIYLGGLAAALSPLLLILGAARSRAVPVSARQRWLLAGGTVALLLAFTWPLAALAQVSVAGRATQYLLLTLAAPPLLLLGTPRWAEDGRGWLRRVAERFAGAPWVGALLLLLTAAITHTAAVVDATEGEPLLQAGIRGAWFAAAILYWWPLVGPGPERERLPYLAGLGYLVLPFVVPKFPAAVWVFSTEPLYERYVAFDRPWELSLVGDQGLAGLILWIPGSVVVAVSVYLLLRHWLREDRRLSLRQRLDLPADPRAIEVLMAHPDAWHALEALIRIVDDAAPPRLGSDLGCVVDGDRVVLQLHVPERGTDQGRLRRQVEAGFNAHLRTYGARADRIREHLAVEVVPYGARVQ